jgi:hypothetical protein
MTQQSSPEEFVMKDPKSTSPSSTSSPNSRSASSHSSASCEDSQTSSLVSRVDDCEHENGKMSSQRMSNLKGFVDVVFLLWYICTKNKNKLVLCDLLLENLKHTLYIHLCL